MCQSGGAVRTLTQVGHFRVTRNNKAGVRQVEESEESEADANDLWLVEEVLAREEPRPIPDKITDLFKGATHSSRQP